MVEIKEIMHAVTIVPEDMTVLEVAQLMEDKNTTAVLVGTPGEIAGILTERDILTKVTARAIDPRLIRLSQIMTPAIQTIESTANIIKAAEMMDTKGIRHLPVTREGKIVGIVRAHDISRSMPFAVYSRVSSNRKMDENHYPEF